MTNPIDVILPGALHKKLDGHLFPGDLDEHGAAIAVSTVTTARGTRLLGHRLFCARDGVDYVAGVRGYRQLRAEFIAKAMDYCRENGLGLLMVHNHGGVDRVGFSGTDLASHERGYPTLRDLMDGQPVGALVFARSAAAGDIWFANGLRQSIRSVRVTDVPMRNFTPAPLEVATAACTYARQLLMFSHLGQARLAECRVAIVGLGGVGSLLAEFLARLGVGTLLLIDPDRLEVTNLSRVVAATRWDVRWPLSASVMPAIVQRLARRFSAHKTVIAARAVHRANPTATVESFADNVARASVADACRDSDFVFLAADSMQARLVVNALVQQYLIPGLQIGSKVVTHDDQLLDAFSVVRWLMPGAGCLWCNGLISPERLAWEAKTDQEQLAQRYGTDAPNPSVLPINAVGAGHTAARFMCAYLGLSDSGLPLDLRIHHLSGEMYHDTPRQDPQCPECSASGRLGRGLTRALPTLPD